MKKRILLSLVSFFMMTAMWASLTEAYQIYVTAANGKTNNTAELTLNMKNRNAIAIWQCTLVLPEGVTFVNAEIVNGRYPEGFEPQLKPTVDGNKVTLLCEGADNSLTLTGNDGAVAKVVVNIGNIEPKDYVVDVTACKLTEPNDGTIYEREHNEFTWTIEQGEASITGDLNTDGAVDIADVVKVLTIMAQEGTAADYPAADLNNDGVIDIADVVAILTIMAAQ